MGLQGIKSGDQGSFRRDQGISLSSAIWHSPLVTNPIIGAVGRDARARVQRTHRRWGTEGSNPSPSSGESVSRGTLSSWVKNRGFPRGCAGLRSRRGRQRLAGARRHALTRGNISLRRYSSTVFPAMRSPQLVGSKSQGWFPTEVGPRLGLEMLVDLASSG
jgi:hypothetical protein